MPAQLLALTDGPSILLDKPILLIGRHPECDIQLNSRKVSRRHCCIAQVRDYIVIRDLGSTNGVRINGDRVLEGRLRAGDELTVGNFKYQVTWEAPGEAKNADSRLERRLKADQALEDAEEPVALDSDLAVSRILEAKPAPGRSAAPISTEGTFDERTDSRVLPSSMSLLPPSSSSVPPTASRPG
jgi:pSer/pThr/pTyr-binding forkhead associated (FHA) protein